MFGGILLISQLVLVFLFLLEVWANEFLRRPKLYYSRFKKNRSSVTHCVVTLFKAKVTSRVNVEYQLPVFSAQYVTLLKSGIHILYFVKLKITIIIVLDL